MGLKRFSVVFKQSSKFLTCVSYDASSHGLSSFVVGGIDRCRVGASWRLIQFEAIQKRDNWSAEVSLREMRRGRLVASQGEAVGIWSAITGNGSGMSTSAGTLAGSLESSEHGTAGAGQSRRQTESADSPIPLFSTN